MIVTRLSAVLLSSIEIIDIFVKETIGVCDWSRRRFDGGCPARVVVFFIFSNSIFLKRMKKEKRNSHAGPADLL